MTDIVKESYNSFETYPLVPYNIISYLMDNEESLWKILKFSDADAWKKPNLTRNEKANLIYNGQSNETDFRVFMDTGQDNSWTVEATFLRVVVGNIIPVVHVFGRLTVGFEIYTHYKVSHLSNYTTRLDYGTQRIISVMNGADIDGIGRLYFDHRASSVAKSVLVGSIPYKGRATVMCNYQLG